MDPQNRKYDEKRDYIRMTIGSPLEATVVDKGTHLQGRCLDLSGGGMLLELDTELPKGTKVEVSVTSEHGHSPALYALAEVTRIEPAINDKVAHGMRIVEMLN